MRSRVLITEGPDELTRVGHGDDCTSKLAMSFGNGGLAALQSFTEPRNSRLVASAGPGYGPIQTGYGTTPNGCTGGNRYENHRKSLEI